MERENIIDTIIYQKDQKKGIRCGLHPEIVRKINQCGGLDRLPPHPPIPIYLFGNDKDEPETEEVEIQMNDLWIRIWPK